MNVKLKFRGYNEKNTGFHLTPKILLPNEPWGMRMQWEHTNVRKFGWFCSKFEQIDMWNFICMGLLSKSHGGTSLSKPNFSNPSPVQTSVLSGTQVLQSGTLRYHRVVPSSDIGLRTALYFRKVLCKVQQINTPRYSRELPCSRLPFYCLTGHNVSLSTTES